MKSLFGLVLGIVLCLSSMCNAQETGGPPMPNPLPGPLVCGKIHNHSSAFILVWRSDPSFPNGPGIYRMLNPNFSTPSYEDWDFGCDLSDRNTDGTLKWHKCSPGDGFLDMYFGPALPSDQNFWLGNKFWRWEITSELIGEVTWFYYTKVGVPQEVAPEWIPINVYENLPTEWTQGVPGSYWNGSGGGPTPPGP